MTRSKIEPNAVSTCILARRAHPAWPHQDVASNWGDERWNFVGPYRGHIYWEEPGFEMGGCWYDVTWVDEDLEL